MCKSQDEAKRAVAGSDEKVKEIQAAFSWFADEQVRDLWFRDQSLLNPHY